MPKKTPKPKKKVPAKKPKGEWPEEDRGKPEWIEKIRNLPQKSWRERPVTLKYKNAMVRQSMYGLTNQEIADELGIKKDTYKAKKTTDEGRAFLAKIREYEKDDFKIISDRMRDEAYHAYENMIMARDRMYEAGDLVNAVKIDKDILKSTGFWEKQDINVNLEGQSITLQFGSGTDIGSLEEGPIVETEYELLPEPDDPSDADD